MEQQPPTGNAESTVAEIAVRDPLSPVTRKERLYLLAVSMIGIAVVKTGLVPTKIATFGIELDKPNRNALLFLLALVTVYFFLAFVIYAASDYIARREALQSARKRDQSALRFQEVAIRLGTSEENIRRLNATGDLWEYVQNQGNANQEEELREVLDLYGDFNPMLVERALKARGRELVYITDPSIRGTLSFLGLRMFGTKQTRGMWLTGVLRVFFEFLLPLLVGGYAVYTLLSQAHL